MKKEIYVTGAGIVSALGLGKDANLRALINQQSGVRPIQFLETAHRDLPAGEVKHSNDALCEQLGIPPAEAFIRSSLLAIPAVQEALEQARIGDLAPTARVALLSGISEFIPVLGPTVASALGTVTTAATAWGITLQTALFYLALTQINHNIVYPALVGKSLHLHPVAVILGVVFGGEILGAAGMFLAVPFIVIVKIVITDIYRDRQEMKDGGEYQRVDT